MVTEGRIVHNPAKHSLPGIETPLLETKVVTPRKPEQPKTLLGIETNHLERYVRAIVAQKP